jgi:hypothetical protein
VLAAFNSLDNEYAKSYHAVVPLRIRAHGKNESDNDSALFALDEFLSNVWLTNHPQHGWEIDEVRRREREAAERRKRRARLTRKRS